MKEDFARLLDAQDIDLEIDRLQRARKDYPQEIQTLKKEIEDMQGQIADAENRLTENIKNRGLIEAELEVERELRVKKEERLLETTSNKEYNAVQSEIEQARQRIDNLETEDLQLMNEVDELTPRIEGLKASYEEINAKNTTRIDDVQQKYDSIETDISARLKRREAALNEVNSRAKSVYNRLRKGKNGIAVAHVDHTKFSCGGCHKQLPPQKVVEVRRTNRLIFCENCGRILVWDPRDEME